MFFLNIYKINIRLEPVTLYLKWVILADKYQLTLISINEYLKCFIDLYHSRSSTSTVAEFRINTTIKT